MPPTATASRKLTGSGPAIGTTIATTSHATKKGANPSQKVAVRSNRPTNAAKSGGATANAPSPVVLPSDWPVRSSSPPRLLKFYRDILQEENDEDDLNAFGFSDQKVKSTAVSPSVPTAAACSDSSSSSAALRPGPLLQGCSGKDIQLSRNAVSGTNVAKEKGRYLLFLPGLLSLKNPPPTVATAAATSTTKAKDADEDNSDTSMDNDEHEKDTEKKDSLAIATTASALPTLGRLEQLSTATPLLKVPFLTSDAAVAIGDTANNHTFMERMLCFPGTKVDTSSKFMMLTCSQKRGGSVTCKVRIFVGQNESMQTQRKPEDGYTIWLLLCRSLFDIVFECVRI
jgi:hypothetical protein